jgi:predicted DNA-binding protein (MmcQ/YjbR family)
MSEPKSLDNPYELALREVALGYPGTHEDFPWGHRVIKVKGKAFIFMSNEEARLGLSVKLPHSNAAALMLPFASPTGYGLGKSGWVSASFAKGERPPMELLRQWLDESYRAVAPKKLVAQLAAEPVQKVAAAKKKAPVKKKTALAKKKTVARKTAGTREKRAR